MTALLPLQYQLGGMTLRSQKVMAGDPHSCLLFAMKRRFAAASVQPVTIVCHRKGLGEKHDSTAHMEEPMRHR